MTHLPCYGFRECPLELPRRVAAKADLEASVVAFDDQV